MIKFWIVYISFKIKYGLIAFNKKHLHIKKPRLPTLPKLPAFPKLPALPKLPKLPAAPKVALSMPRLSLPKITLPRPTLPEMSLPKITLPSLTLPKPKLPQLPRLPRPDMSGPLVENLAIAIVIISSLAMLAAGLGYKATNAREDISRFLPSNNSFMLASTAEAVDTQPPANIEIERQVTEKEQDKPQYKPSDKTLDVEAVLVPRQVTVISSSRDGRIAEIPVHNGDTFNKGDILLRYDCRDLEAEAQIASNEKSLTQKKAEGSYRLFKLDLISDLDRESFINESEKAKAREKLYEARLEHCIIRADFDGRVTNRLANPGEFTRTDRVLLEVASEEPLQAEFLIPSIWLRWVNTGAPLNITINETENTYEAEITRIYGEVDPVSQSIQIVARLSDYKDRLLPGMSGQATLDIDRIRKAGVNGFLEHKTAQAD